MLTKEMSCYLIQAGYQVEGELVPEAAIPPATFVRTSDSCCPVHAGDMHLGDMP